MFREMRRIKQLLSNDEAIDILNSRTSGVMGVIGDDGYPYTVPLSYTHDDGKLYIHCAKEGHKIDSINNNDKVTFCVIDKDDVVQETFTTHFRSVSIFGRARILKDDAERLNALRTLVKKYSPDFITEGEDEIKKTWERVCLIEIKIEHMTGKAAIEIIKASK